MNFNLEKSLKKRGLRFIAGIDEVGRGALAGPVYAAAVIYLGENLDKEIRGIKDSKKLTPLQREKFYEILTNRNDVVWACAQVSQKYIDENGIDKSVWLAMQEAVFKLKTQPDFLLIDGNRFYSDKIGIEKYKLIIKGDDKVFSIAAASIIAKVTRDRLMEKMSDKYPRYFFDKNKGYGTKDHLSVLRDFGSSDIHRQRFLKKIIMI